MLLEMKKKSGSFVPQASSKNIEHPDNKNIWFRRPDAKTPTERNVTGVELGWVNRLNGDVYIRLSGGELYNITQSRESSRTKDDVELALLTSYQTIFSNNLYMWYGDKEDKTILNQANTIACATMWKGSLNPKQHSILTVYRNTTAYSYKEVLREEAYLKEKFSCIYMFTKDGIIAVPLAPSILIREAA